MQLASDHVELGSDEGAFAIRGDLVRVPGAPWSTSTLILILDDAVELGDVLVSTSDQWGPFSVTTRVLDRPEPPLDDWEDIAEFSVETHSGLTVTEVVNNDPSAVLLVDPGTYRVRVSARGRTVPTDQDDDHDDKATEPVEHYLVEAWPADLTAPTVVRETSPYAQHVLAGPAPEPVIHGQEAGLAGARAVGRDVDESPGARVLSGATGELSVRRTIAAPRRKLFKYLRSGPTMSEHVPSWEFMSGPDWQTLGASTYSHAGDDHPDQLSGRRGLIRNIVVEEDRPQRRVSRLAWMVPPPGKPGGSPDERTVIVDSTVIITYTQAKGSSGEAITTIEVQHFGVPVEWAEDLRAWWTYQLAFVEHRATRTADR